MPPLAHPDEYELVDRTSLDSHDDDFDLDDFEAGGPVGDTHGPRSLQSMLARLVSFPFNRKSRGYRPARDPLKHAAWNIRRRHRVCRLLCSFVGVVVGILFAMVALTALFFPSYTRLPAHYQTLRQTVAKSVENGRGNPRGEKVFIAASIYDRDGSLAKGAWAENVLQLIDLLGPDNVFLSIYENDTGDVSASALGSLEERVPCNRSLVYEPHLDLKDVQHITLPDGSERVKRIAYLAEARNRALRPLDDPNQVQFDKLLYMNDVYFDPVDILHLLFSTNADDEGKARYRAACSIDFINPLKFYDTFASRDLEGYGMGLPLYPWFSSAGKAESRSDVQAQKDAVRVRSCWSGIVAFDAQFFQRPSSLGGSHGGVKAHQPARFRAETDPYWDASECCLIHADIQVPPEKSPEPTDTGIYMNPFVRVAYDQRTLSWLGVTRRFERLFSLPQNLINHLVGLPWFNPRRTEKAGEVVEEKVWVPTADGRGGSYQRLTREAGTGGFCGRRGLQVMVPNPQKGQKNWEMIAVPSKA